MGARGERLVLTNGCFDILHVGHIRYLTDASRLGDALAVAVNGDNSVRRLKGAGRPIVPENERATLIAALECVDYVCIFGEDTALELVRDVRPAIYVKGGDYSDDPSNNRFPLEGREVLAYGGAVHILPFVVGRSTSQIIKKIQNL